MKNENVILDENLDVLTDISCRIINIGDILRSTYQDHVQEFGHSHIDFEVKFGWYIDYSVHSLDDIENEKIPRQLGLYIAELNGDDEVAQYPLTLDIEVMEVVQNRTQFNSNTSLIEAINQYIPTYKC